MIAHPNNSTSTAFGSGLGHAGRRTASYLAVALFALLVAGCATVPKDHPRPVSTAFPDYLDSSLGKLFEQAAAAHPSESGFVIIRWGRPAFTSRIAITELAEKSLDMQYYIWEGDATGRILAERLVDAADRGVRVRILVDDINLGGKDAVIASLDAHPNIEIRIFNPFANRDLHGIDFLTDLARINHRMHNKIMVADNAVAIVGGRNIGDHYFGVSTDANFRDLDIAAVGPVVRQTSGVFDYFWNGDWAVPIAALADHPYTEEDLRATLETFHDRLAEEPYPYPLDKDVAKLTSDLASIREHLVWAPGKIVWNDPAAIEEDIQEGKMIKAFYRKINTLDNELLIESAYFVPREKSVEALQRLHQRGVRVRVLTNSLASNDVIAAHAGYEKLRKQMVENGAELYEMRPDAGVIKKSVVSHKSKAALHTKAMVFDGEAVFIGSLNLDPRSANINTEAGLYVDSPELARQVMAYMDEGVLPKNSYRVLVDEEGDLVWVTEIDGREVRYHHDPETTFGQRLISDIIKMLPVEHQL